MTPALVLAALLPLSAFAESDSDFTAPPAAFTNTKYSQDCGGDTPNLRPDLPPMDDQYDQKNAPWCVSFNAKLMLEYQYHRGHPADPYKTRFSVVDINSKDSHDGSREATGPNLTGGTNIASLLTGVEDSGEVYEEKDRPFDPEIFNHGNLVEQLTDYYNTQRPYAKAGAFECRDRSPLFQRLEKDFGSLLNALRDSEGVSEFVDKATAAHPVAARARPGAKPVSVKPLEFRQFQAANGDQFVDELRKSLGSRTPVSINLCGIALELIPGLGNGEAIPPAQKNKCGPHALMATRLVSQGGKCMVELRSSWGRAWPPKGGNGQANPRGENGYGMVSLDELLGILQLDNGRQLMTSLKPAAEASGKGNTLVNADGWVFEGRVLSSAPYDGRFTGKRREGGFFYDGEMKKGLPSGRGHLIANDGTETNGIFLDGKFVEGTFKGPLGTSGATFEGMLKNGFPNGQGTLRRANGSVRTGLFEDGTFREGASTGPWDDHSSYDGEVRNGLPSGKGHLSSDDGTDMNGRFLDGKFVEGVFKGPWTKHLAYEGEVRNGVWDGKGKLLFDEGAKFEGEFRSGALWNGRYDGPWNGDPGRIYHGPIVGGRTTSEGQWSPSPPAGP